MSPTTSIWLPDHRAVALRQTPASSMLLAATRGQIHPEHVFAVTTLYSVTELREILGFEQIVIPERGMMNIIFGLISIHPEHFLLHRSNISIEESKSQCYCNMVIMSQHYHQYKSRGSNQ